MRHYDPRRNAEGYMDMTAYIAITRADRDARRKNAAPPRTITRPAHRTYPVSVNAAQSTVTKRTEEQNHD
jgi:hypothetical protein